jgi:hypothetical protein
MGGVKGGEGGSGFTGYTYRTPCSPTVCRRRLANRRLALAWQVAVGRATATGDPDEPDPRRQRRYSAALQKTIGPAWSKPAFGIRD